MSTVQSGKVFESLIRDTIRDGLRAAQDDTGYLFEDGAGRTRPAVPDKDGPSALVLTSFPSRDVTYPHVVVKESGDSAELRDSRVTLWKHDYAVRFECYGRSSTEAGKLTSGVKEWVEKNVTTLRDAGFHDISIGGSSDMQHFDDVRVSAKKITVSGTLYTV